MLLNSTPCTPPPHEIGHGSSAGLIELHAPVSYSRTGPIAKCFDVTALTLLTAAAGTLLFRPADLLPALDGAPIYELLIIACIVAATPNLLHHFTARSIRSNGVLVLLLLLVPAVVLSHLTHGDTYEARIGGAAMLKACVFSLLVISLVDTPGKIRLMLLAILGATTAVTSLSLLHYAEILNVPALASIEQRGADPETDGTILRLCGIGVFNDPNDFSLLLVIAMSICVYGVLDGTGVVARVAMLVPFFLFSVALYFTHSRSGFLAALVAMLAFMQARLGWRNALTLAALSMPVIFALASGRQTSLNLEDPDDTFQTRMQLWDAAFTAFRSVPFFGLGEGRVVETLGHVAHNSYMQAFAEMGFFGGSIFLGAVAYVLRGVYRATPSSRALHLLRPCMLGIIASYASGLFSLSRCYTVPTQLVLALSTAYIVMAAREQPTGAAPLLPRFDWQCIGRVGRWGIGVLVLTYVFVQVMIRQANG